MLLIGLLYILIQKSVIERKICIKTHFWMDRVRNWRFFEAFFLAELFIKNRGSQKKCLRDRKFCDMSRTERPGNCFYRKLRNLMGPHIEPLGPPTRHARVGCKRVEVCLKHYLKNRQVMVVIILIFLTIAVLVNILMDIGQCYIDNRLIS